MKLLIALLALVPAYAATAAIDAGVSVPAGFTAEVLAQGFTKATAMEFAPDGRLFVAEQAGRVRVVKNGALLAAPFLTVSTDSTGEGGLLGIAFDPSFASNKFVYIYYTVPGSPPRNRVSRFTANGDVAASGMSVILELDPLNSTHHHYGGAIHFGADGKLYVAVGENAVSANAQKLSNRLGKILRINSNGTLPADNPTSFQGVTGTTSGNNRAIWAIGLRNPFTFAIKRGSGKILLNDVGQSKSEEINVGARGKNYGWPATEGPTANPSFTSPLYSYPHSGGSVSGCAISGGAFYDSSVARFPSSYVGKYFFADLCAGRIWNINPDISSPTATQFAAGIAQPVDLKVGRDGLLYYLARGENLVGRITTARAPTQGPVTPGTGPSSRPLAIGNRVQVIGGQLRPRVTPGGPYTCASCVQTGGALGTVTRGPVTTRNGEVWWNVNFNTGADGWVGQTRLQRT